MLVSRLRAQLTRLELLSYEDVSDAELAPLCTLSRLTHLYLDSLFIKQARGVGVGVGEGGLRRREGKGGPHAPLPALARHQAGKWREPGRDVGAAAGTRWGRSSPAPAFLFVRILTVLHACDDPRSPTVHMPVLPDAEP